MKGNAGSVSARKGNILLVFPIVIALVILLAAGYPFFLQPRAMKTQKETSSSIKPEITGSTANFPTYKSYGFNFLLKKSRSATVNMQVKTNNEAELMALFDQILSIFKFVK